MLTPAILGALVAFESQSAQVDEPPEDVADPHSAQSRAERHDGFAAYWERQDHPRFAALAAGLGGRYKHRGRPWKGVDQERHEGERDASMAARAFFEGHSAPGEFHDLCNSVGLRTGNQVRACWLVAVSRYNPKGPRIALRGGESEMAAALRVSARATWNIWNRAEEAGMVCRVNRYKKSEAGRPHDMAENLYYPGPLMEEHAAAVEAMVRREFGAPELQEIRDVGRRQSFRKWNLDRRAQKERRDNPGTTPRAIERRNKKLGLNPTVAAFWDTVDGADPTRDHRTAIDFVEEHDLWEDAQGLAALSLNVDPLPVAEWPGRPEGSAGGPEAVENPEGAGEATVSRHPIEDHNCTEETSDPPASGDDPKPNRCLETVASPAPSGFSTASGPPAEPSGLPGHSILDKRADRPPAAVFQPRDAREAEDPADHPPPRTRGTGIALDEAGPRPVPAADVRASTPAREPVRDSVQAGARSKLNQSLGDLWRSGSEVAAMLSAALERSRKK